MYDLIAGASVDDGMTAQLLMTEAYDQGYGIFDHESFDATDPLSIIGMHPAEDIITGSKISVLEDELVAIRLPELTNTPLVELMNWPKYKLDRWINKLRPGVQKEQERTKELERQLEENQR